MTDYDDTQESLGVLEALEEAFGVDDGVGSVGYGHDGCANS